MKDNIFESTHFSQTSAQFSSNSGYVEVIYPTTPEGIVPGARYRIEVLEGKQDKTLYHGDLFAYDATTPNRVVMRFRQPSERGPDELVPTREWAVSVPEVLLRNFCKGRIVSGGTYSLLFSPLES